MIEIDATSPVPLYRQIAEQFQRLIAIGALKPGDRLPTVRDLAVRLRINRNTAARAIQQLEKDGLVRTRVGIGTFVGEAAPRANRASLERFLDGSIDRLLLQARTLGMPLEELGERLARRASVLDRLSEEA
jgi:GntR family transcriptional regulator